jgi:P pilus assembly/Cpx signaling pathway, periplasmic inhibitor/zinc-resistance associated protein
MLPTFASNRLTARAALVGLFLALAAATTGPAQAGWGHGGGWRGGGWHEGGWRPSGWHGGTFFGFSLNLPLTLGYPGPYYYPAPTYYAPPRIVYLPEPQAATPTSPTYLSPRGRYCREFQMPGVVNGQRVQMHGTACLEPDGTWRVVG